ncbi:ribonuclease E activity regulator RraA [Marivita hallyeonensis]|uniref:4-hydroxy-4-methyl-2-oxoglutarate aldolase n=1 Tax=Marivita hallyeonensis TaxID=996342 RepID=A0A1M5RUE2_9RHOB|nr:ribonuclease E activity regulator RraA [Marivita hallyeonensis]SHH29846.1 regulator of ribonuclease activity A [Marivita hallyeonensis]
MKPTCDHFDDHGDALGVLPAGLRHYGGTPAFHGPAVTVKTFEVNSRVKELANTPGEGRVIVVDGGGSLRRALCGDVIAAEAAEHGWAGIIIWGAVRDVEMLSKTPIGIMAMGHTPARCVRKGEGEVDCAIRIDGVAIAPGDYVVADADGALVFPKDGPQPSF